MEVAGLKKEMLALMLAMNERLERAEAIQAQQNAFIQVRCSVLCQHREVHV